MSPAGIPGCAYHGLMAAMVDTPTSTLPAGAVPSAAAGGYWLIYDGHCPFCRASVRLLRAMNWLGRIRVLDLHTAAAEVAARAPELTREQLMAAMHLLTPRGRIYAGFFASRRAAWVLPPVWPIIWLFYLPGMSRCGPSAYAWVARHRYGLARCDADSGCRR